MNEPEHLLRNLFAEALEISDASQRAAFLARECGADANLRHEVEELIQAEADAGHFLPEKPATTGSGPALRELVGALGQNDALPTSSLIEKPDDHIGRYKLLKKIGEGGCGVVYQAGQEEPVRRQVALKVIKLGMDTKSVVARFEAERQALAMMDHANIAKVLDAGVTDAGRPFFVMELVQGIKITDYCDQHQLATRERLELFIQVCQAVQHAHQKGIIHRDLKPSNILVTVNDGVPVPKVIDFGIAKATEGKLTDQTIFTAFEQFLGTPAYMSPEQAAMTNLDIDTRSDIYSLGVLLYELLTGTTPFDTKTLLASGVDELRRTIREKERVRPSARLTRRLATASKVGRDTPCAPSSGDKSSTRGARGATRPTAKSAIRNPQSAIDPDLDWIVMKCLEKDRTRRYETANGLAADLARHLNNEPVLARPPSAAYRFQKAFRRNKLMFTAATAVAVALVVGIGVSTWQTFEARKAQRATELARKGEETQRREAQQKQAEAEAERQRANAQTRKASESEERSRRLLYVSDMNLVQKAWEDGNLKRAQTLLQAHIPNAGETDLRGFEWRYLWKLCQEDQSLHTVKFEADDPVRRLATSPAHSFVAAVCDKTIRLLEPSTGRELVRFSYPNLEAPNPRPALALAAGMTNLMAAHRAEGVVGFWDLANRKLAMTFQPFTNNVNVLALSPDGKYFAAADQDRFYHYSAVLTVWDISTLPEAPSLVWSNSTTSAITAMAISPDGQVLAVASDLGDEVVIDSWELKTKRELKRIRKASTGIVRAISFSPDGSLLVSGGIGGQIKVWNFTDRIFRNDFDGHPGVVESLAFSADGTQLISAGDDGTLRRWDTSSGKADGLWRLPQSGRAAAVFAPDGKFIVSASPVEVRIWSTAPHEKATTFNVPHGWSWQIVSPDSRNLIVSGLIHAAGPQEVTVWDIASGRHKFDLVSEEINPQPLAFSPNGRLFAVGSVEKEGLVGLWDATAWDNGASRYKPFAYLTNGFECASLSFSPDGKILAAAGPCFPPSGPKERNFATNRLAFWEVESGKRLNLLPQAGVGATEWAAAASVAFAPNGRLLAVGSRDGWVRLWDLKQQQLLKGFKAHDAVEWAVEVAFSSDNRWLASYSLNGPSLVLFDLADPEHAHEVHLNMEESGRVLWALFAQDNKTLVAANGDGLIKFWNLQTRSVALTLRHGHGPGGFLAMAPDGNFLVSKDGNGIVKIWPAAPLAEIPKFKPAEKEGGSR